MLKPTLDELVDKVDSKYTLVVAAAKRAREIVDGKSPLVADQTNKPVTIALREIAAGKLLYERTKSGIK